ncbi:MAG: HNH endonuclease family protein [Thermodesulfobacteriota bacterium]|nr:HNH endonuclease family protein [Thermodesulfobacteriota bacterium]
MLSGLPSTDWVPPLLRYYEKFDYNKIMDFLVLLDNKFSADWIVQYTPTMRIEKMNQLIRIIDGASSSDEVLGGDGFQIDKDSFKRAIDSAVYGRRFTRYLLLKLDYLYHDDSHKMSIEALSVEHILPQNPSEGSQWVQDFTDEQRKEWTDRLGNLVLISTRKNTSQGRLDYSDKKARYFQKRISTCPNSLRVLNNYNQWTMVELKENHIEVLNKLNQHYGVL